MARRGSENGDSAPRLRPVACGCTTHAVSFPRCSVVDDSDCLHESSTS